MDNLQDTSVRTSLPSRATFHLSIVQVWVHRGSGVQKPSFDVIGNVSRIVGGSGDGPRQGIVQDSIRHGLEVARVVDKATIRVEQSVPRIIRAGDID